MNLADYPCRTAGCGHLATEHVSESDAAGPIPCTSCDCDAFRNDEYAAAVADVPGARLPEPEVV